MLTNTINNAAYRWRRAALFTSEMSVFDAVKGGKRTAPATAHRAATRAWIGPIT